MTDPDRRSADAAPASVDGITVLLIIARDRDAIAAAARLTIAGVQPGRRAAVFDLAGAFDIQAGDGLIAAFREGRSLNALAQPFDSGSDERFLVPRGPGIVDEALIRHERWPRLVEGFRSTGALLIVTALPDFPALDSIEKLAEVVLRRGEAEAARVAPPSPPPPAASPPPVSRTPGPKLPRTTVPQSSPAISRNARASRRVWIITATLVVLATAGWSGIRFFRKAPVVVKQRTDSLEALDAVAPVAPDTVGLPVVANPADSARAAAWAVELVATNDRSDAMFRLAEQSAVPSGTLSPVLLGGDRGRWYKVVAGAFVDRSGAEYLRATLRRAGKLDAEAGVVTRAPYAIRLATDLALDAAKTKVAELGARRIASYALMDDGGRAAVYAGAFATPAQAALLFAELRTAGENPELTFRVGRAY